MDDRVLRRYVAVVNALSDEIVDSGDAQQPAPVMARLAAQDSMTRLAVAIELSRLADAVEQLAQPKQQTGWTTKQLVELIDQAMSERKNTSQLVTDQIVKNGNAAVASEARPS